MSRESFAPSGIVVDDHDVEHAQGAAAEPLGPETRQVDPPAVLTAGYSPRYYGGRGDRCPLSNRHEAEKAEEQESSASERN
jgi:hypothetical protein